MMERSFVQLLRRCLELREASKEEEELWPGLTAEEVEFEGEELVFLDLVVCTSRITFRI